MAETVTATVNGNRVNISKEDLLRQVTKEFVAGNPAQGLRVGLMI